MHMRSDNNNITLKSPPSGCDDDDKPNNNGVTCSGDEDGKQLKYVVTFLF